MLFYIKCIQRKEIILIILHLIQASEYWCFIRVQHKILSLTISNQLFVFFYIITTYCTKAMDPFETAH